MFAGRNISATHIAFASTRVMATCAVVGQGVGTAAAFASRHNLFPSDLYIREEIVSGIQQQLLKDDAYLVGILNNDPEDLARAAQITASNEQTGGEATQVVSGQTRSVHGKQFPDDSLIEDTVELKGNNLCIHAPSDRAFPASHRWMSDPRKELPAWIAFEWEYPIDLHEIILVFDTGLHRLLTLTHASGYAKRMKWGQPQPETVKDYNIDAHSN